MSRLGMQPRTLLSQVGGSMKGKVLFGLMLVLAVASPAQGQASRRLSIKDQAKAIPDAQKLIQGAALCAEKGDYACATAKFGAARGLLERLPDDVRAEGDPQEMLWTCYLRLGLAREAKKWFEIAQPDVQDKWKSDMESLQATYGAISLESPEPMLADRTLNVARVEIVPVGGVLEFPANLVRDRAAREILQAYRNKDLLTDPIVLPVGANRLHFELSRESSLNYSMPSITKDFDVPQDEAVPLSIDPKRNGLPVKILAVLGPMILIPILVVE